MFRTLAALTTALAGRHQHDRVRADDVADFYRGKTDPPGHRLRHRRRLRRLCQVARALPRRAHPRQAHRDRAEHAGRRQPQRRQLALQGRAQGRHRAGGAQPGHAGRPGARPARHPVRRAQVQLDRQHGGGQQHHDHLARERRAHHRGREEASRSRSAPPARARRRCSIRRSPTICSARSSRSCRAIPAAATS